MDGIGQPDGERLNDRELVDQALHATEPDRRRQALEAIADRYLREVSVATARRMGDAEAAADVTQEAFADAFAKLMEREGPPNPDRLGGWLINFSRNRERNYYKRQGAVRERTGHRLSAGLPPSTPRSSTCGSRPPRRRCGLSTSCRRRTTGERHRLTGSRLRPGRTG